MGEAEEINWILLHLKINKETDHKICIYYITIQCNINI